jgi:hypothetical protein
MRNWRIAANALALYQRTRLLIGWMHKGIPPGAASGFWHLNC